MRFIFAFISIVITIKVYGIENSYIKIGYFDIKPFSFYDEKRNKDSGVILDYLKNKIVVVKNKKVIFQQYPLSRVLTELKFNKIDAIAFLGKTPEREKEIIYTKTPIYSSNSYLMLLKDSDLNEIEDIDDLNKETIGIGQNGALCNFLSQNRAKLTIEESSAENYSSVLINKLKFKRITAAYSYLPDSLYYEAKANNFLNDIKMLLIPNNKISVYLVFSKKFNPKYLDIIEDNLKNNNLNYKPEFEKSDD